jgi:hypothetical protein
MPEDTPRSRNGTSGICLFHALGISPGGPRSGLKKGDSNGRSVARVSPPVTGPVLRLTPVCGRAIESGNRSPTWNRAESMSDPTTVSGNGWKCAALACKAAVSAQCGIAATSRSRHAPADDGIKHARRPIPPRPHRGGRPHGDSAGRDPTPRMRAARLLPPADVPGRPQSTTRSDPTPDPVKRTRDAPFSLSCGLLRKRVCRISR